MTRANTQITTRALCRGVDPNGNCCFDKPVPIKVTFRGYYCGWDVSVACPYIGGGHGQRCKASHPGIEKRGEGVNCVYVWGVSAPGAMVTDPDPNEEGPKVEDDDGTFGFGLPHD